MTNDLRFRQILHRFSDFRSMSRSFKPYALKLPPTTNERVIAAANRSTAPVPFKAFVRACEENLNITIPNDWLITKEYILASDNENIATMTKSNFDSSKLHSMLLVKAGYQAAVDLCMFEGLGKSRVTPFSNVFDDVDATSSSCYPLFKKKGNTEAKEQARSWAKEYINKPISHRNLLSQVAVLFHRFQYKFNSDNPDDIIKKVRQIWGIPYSIYALESRYFRELYSRVKAGSIATFEPRTTIGRNLPNVSSTIIDKFQNSGSRIASFDVTRFDSNIPSWMYPLFFSIAHEAIDIPYGEVDHFNSLMLYYIYTPFVRKKTGEIEFQKRGNASGNYITALFNTWVTRTVINYAWLTSGQRAFPYGSSVALGDDNLVRLGNVDPYHIQHIYMLFGFDTTLEITEPFEPFNFIGYLWDAKARPTQLLNWYISHFCFPSTFYTKQSIPIYLLQTFRALSIALPLHEGMENFMRCIGFKDKVFLDLYNKWRRGEDTIITYFGGDSRKKNLTFPLSDLYKPWNYRASLL
jgi:hypothetical protein